MVQEKIKIASRRGRYWSKKYTVNFNYFRSPFYKSLYKTSLIVKQIANLWSQSGKHSIVSSKFLEYLSQRQQSLVKKSPKKEIFFIKKKKGFKFVASTILRYRISARIKKKHLGRRVIDYLSYLSSYSQWRRTVRFLGVFFKKKGRLSDKLSIELSRLSSKNFFQKKDSIIYRTHSLFIDLGVKLSDYVKQYKRKRFPFFTPESNFSKKYYHLYWEKYLKSFQKDPKFLIRSHPRSRK